MSFCPASPDAGSNIDFVTQRIVGLFQSGRAACMIRNANILIDGMSVCFRSTLSHTWLHTRTQNPERTHASTDNLRMNGCRVRVCCFCFGRNVYSACLGGL
jgi:hypothetical protein